VSDDLGDNTPPKSPKKGRGRGKPFEPGNTIGAAGRPKGSRNKTSIACEALLEGEATAIVRKAIALAKAGDVGMIRALLGYILPKRERHVVLELPTIETASDALLVSRMIVESVASGKLSAAEGGVLSKAVETYVKLVEVVDLETRLESLEQQRGIPH
jgi:hypothetical protein